MRVEAITAESFVIFEAPSPPNRGALDPITVFLRDFGGSGQIVVECYGDAWSTWFGAIGQQTLRAFLAGVAASYLGGRLTASTCRRTAKREEAYVERIAGAVIAALAAPVQVAPSHKVDPFNACQSFEMYQLVVRQNSSLLKQIEVLEDELAALQAAPQGDAQDAARYRKLRREADRLYVEFMNWTFESSESLDEAVDRLPEPTQGEQSHD